MRSHRALLAAASLVLCLPAAPATAQDKLIEEGDNWKYFKGTEDPPAAWNAIEFDDGSWLEGPTPIGYGSDKGIVMGTTLSDMQNSYFTVYSRKKFTVSDPAQIKGLKLAAKYDDGFIAYMNGVEILRKSIAAGPVTKDTAATDHEENPAFETTVLPCKAIEGLKGGDNVLAVESHNATIGSSDLVMSIEIETIASVCPTNLTCTVRTAADNTVTVLVRWTKPLGVTYDSIEILRNGTPVDPAPKNTVTSYTDKTPGTGDVTYKLNVVACGTPCTGDGAPTCTVNIAGGESKFRRGDADDNGNVNITDAVKILGYLFQGQPAPGCLDAADTDDNAAVNITDAVFLLAALFRGGPQPPDPGRETCGPDPTADELAACTYSSVCQ